jgi:hypothetical protein
MRCTSPIRSAFNDEVRDRRAQYLEGEAAMKHYLGLGISIEQSRLRIADRERRPCSTATCPSPVAPQPNATRILKKYLCNPHFSSTNGGFPRFSACLLHSSPSIEAGDLPRLRSDFRAAARFVAAPSAIGCHRVGVRFFARAIIAALDAYARAIAAHTQPDLLSGGSCESMERCDDLEDSAQLS